MNAAPLATPDGTTPNRTSPDRTMRVALIAIAALLLVVAILLAAILLRKPGTSDAQAGASPGVAATESPTASSSPSASPSASVSAKATTTTPTATTTTTKPPPSGPTFSSFSAPSSAACPDDSSVMTITIHWSSSNATSAWIGVATNNAKAEPFDTVPTSGSYDIGFPCSNAHQVYTVTLEDAGGHLTSKSKDIQR